MICAKYRLVTPQCQHGHRGRSGSNIFCMLHSEYNCCSALLRMRPNGTATELHCSTQCINIIAVVVVECGVCMVMVSLETQFLGCRLVTCEQV